VANEYDVVVVGAGTGGYPAAIRAAQLGLRVAVVEKQKALGGTCLIWGCIPTKALLEHAHALKVAQGAKEWGLSIDGPSVRIDMKQVQARKDKVVTTLTKGVEFLFRKHKIDWIKGTARLAGNGNVEVTGDQPQSLHAAKEIVIATGSQPRSVPGVEIDRKRIITSDEAIALQEVPKSIVILGAGAVGVEFGSIFRSFGSDVTVIELLPRLVPVEDEAVSAELQKAFKKRGIKTHTGSKVTGATPTAEGVDLEVQLPDGKVEKLHADYLLVATGRGPVTEGLGAAEAGLRTDRGYIVVDEFYRTGVPAVSAVGDVISFGKPGHPQLAHVSTAEGIAVAERIAGLEARTVNYDQVPGCTFCDPEIGSIGLTEQKAKERGYDVAVGTFPFIALGRAKIAGEIEGFVKIVAEKKYDEILGVHIIGPRATDLIAEASVALRLECTGEELVRTIHAHPTFAEAVGEAAHALHGGAIHI
jgi:dihydrolipoamide dehydrogenase